MSCTNAKNEDDDDSVVVLSQHHSSARAPSSILHNNNNNNNITIIMSQREVVELQSRKTLRFSASDVAAMTGFHPFKNLPQLLYRLVYQGWIGSQLLQMDAQALGIGLLASEEQVWKSLAAQAGPGTSRALEKALTTTQQTTQTIQQAQALKQEVLQQAQASGKLSVVQLKVLQEGTRHVVNTRFGNNHEDNALDQCEEKFGWEVFHRNREILEWKFQKIQSTNDNNTTTMVEPIGEATPCWTASIRETSDTKKIAEKLDDNPTIAASCTAAATSCEWKQRADTKRQKMQASATTPTEDIVDLTDTQNENHIVDTPAAATSTGNLIISPPLDHIVQDTAALTTTVESPRLAPSTPKTTTTSTTHHNAVLSSISQRVTSLVSAPLVSTLKLCETLLGKTPLRASHSDQEKHDPNTEHNSEKNDSCEKESTPSGNPQVGAQIHLTTRNDTINNNSQGDPYPFFVIRGSVDGLREELTPSASSHNKNDTSNATSATYDDDDDSWVMQRIVVELKHRMNRIFHSPPLYEHIQAVVYCFMYKVDSADIVQIMRQEDGCDDGKEEIEPNQKEQADNSTRTETTSDKRTQEDNTGAINDAKLETLANLSDKDNAGSDSNSIIKDKTQETSDGAMGSAKAAPESALESTPTATSESNQCATQNTAFLPPLTTNKIVEAEAGPDQKLRQQRRRKRRSRPKVLSIQADRVSLDDPMFQHRQNWYDVILPRLSSFAEAVYAIRKDDAKRYRLLNACSDPLGQLEKEAWKLLHEECPWLQSCDTAYNRIS